MLLILVRFKLVMPLIFVKNVSCKICEIKIIKLILIKSNKQGIKRQLICKILKPVESLVCFEKGKSSMVWWRSLEILQTSLCFNSKFLDIKNQDRGVTLFLKGKQLFLVGYKDCEISCVWKRKCNILLQNLIYNRLHYENIFSISKV